MHYGAPVVREQAPTVGAVPERSRLLEDLARTVRVLRRSRSWTRRGLAERSGLSVRFLARIESGAGNVSVLRLEALARALGTTADELIRPVADPARIIALVGLRGAGKSTVGPRLARRLSLPFVEMDSLIVEASGLPLDQMFEIHGEAYYRRLEREILRRILARAEPTVLAAAGGVVNEPSTWELLRQQAFVVWLRARAEEHWDRVVAQGDHRPMADNPAAKEELRALLTARGAVYAQAQITVDTSDRSPEEVVDEIQRALAAAEPRPR